MTAFRSWCSEENKGIKPVDSAIRKLGTLYRWEVARLVDVARLTLVFDVSAFFMPMMTRVLAAKAPRSH